MLVLKNISFIISDFKYHFLCFFIKKRKNHHILKDDVNYKNLESLESAL